MVSQAILIVVVAIILAVLFHPAFALLALLALFFLR